MNIIEFLSNRVKAAQENKLEKMGDTRIAKLEAPALQNNVQALNKYYDPQKGRISSWWQRIKSDSRSNLIRTLTQEQKLIIEQAVQLENAAMASRLRRAAFQNHIAQHTALFIEIQVHIKLVKKAAKKGFTLDNWQEDRAKQEDFKREQKALKAERKFQLEFLDKEISGKLYESTLDLDNFRQKEAIKLNNQIEEWRQNVRFALLGQSLGSQEKKLMIQEKLDALYLQIEDIKNGTFDQTTKDRMVKDREKIIKDLTKFRNTL